MLKFLFRLAAFTVGVLLLVEAGLTTAVQTLAIDRHTTSSTRSSSNSRVDDTSYNIHFASAALPSCSVGLSAYNKLKDGDVVEVRLTRLLSNCVRISRGGELIEAYRLWRIVGIVGGLFFMAVGLGWISATYDPD